MSIQSPVTNCATAGWSTMYREHCCSSMRAIIIEVDNKCLRHLNCTSTKYVICDVLILKSGNVSHYSGPRLCQSKVVYILAAPSCASVKPGLCLWWSVCPTAGPPVGVFGPTSRVQAVHYPWSNPVTEWSGRICQNGVIF